MEEAKSVRPSSRASMLLLQPMGKVLLRSMYEETMLTYEAGGTCCWVLINLAWRRVGCCLSTELPAI